MACVAGAQQHTDSGEETGTEVRVESSQSTWAWRPAGGLGLLLRDREEAAGGSGQMSTPQTLSQRLIPMATKVR